MNGPTAAIELTRQSDGAFGVGGELGAGCDPGKELVIGGSVAIRRSSSARPRPAYTGLPGQPLTEADLAMLKSCGICEEAAVGAGLRRVNDIEGREIVGRRGQGNCAGIVVPYFWPDEHRPRAYRLRRDSPDFERDSRTGELKERAKYLSAPGSSSILYVAPGTPLEWLSDPSVPLIITEGEKKALALAELFRWAGLDGVVIALQGVWNFRGTVGKATGPNGDRRDVKGTIPDFDRICWTNRIVMIIFDSNVESNPSVGAARQHLAWELKRRKAKVLLVNVPGEGGINGIDDYIGAHSATAALGLIKAAVPFEGRMRVGQYEASDAGIVRIIRKETGSEEVPLTNFTVFFTGQRVQDDGLEQVRYFDVEAHLHGKRLTRTIPAAKFDSLDWVPGALGAEAVVYPGHSTKEHVRVAIRKLSGERVPEICTYTHTGWREIGDQWLYLYNGGAIGANGAVPGISVSLPEVMQRYELPDPPEGGGLRRCVQASLDCWNLAQDEISVPMHAATFRATLGNCDASIFLAGHTGRGKSEIAGRFQQHFGAKWERKNLPANWSSTANALESLAHSAKDALLVIDDFVPHGAAHDIARTHKDADRVSRGQGNQSGRQRMRADGSDSPGRHPRGLIVATGEDVPRGQSLASRMMILQLGPSDVQWDRMTEAQQAGREGVYAAAMAGFLKWCAGRYSEIQKQLPAMIEMFRREATEGAGHKHTPEIIANLAIGLHYFLEFAEAVGAVTNAERLALRARGWKALCAAGGSQQFHQLTNDPTEQFLTHVRSALTSGRAYIANKDGSTPPMCRAWGWRDEGVGLLRGRGDLIGWLDGDYLYLDPEASYRVVQLAVRDSNGSLALTQSALWKRLKEKGVLASTDEKRQTFKVRREVNGAQVAVLHLRAATVNPVEESEPDTDVGCPTAEPTATAAANTGVDDEMSGMSVKKSNESAGVQEELFG
jgi:Domain of unknown function (DUF3854)